MNFLYFYQVYVNNSLCIAKYSEMHRLSLSLTNNWCRIILSIYYASLAVHFNLHAFQQWPENDTFCDV